MKMAVALFRERIQETINKRRMFRDLFTPWFILKNSIELTCCSLFNKGFAAPVLHVDIKVTGKCNGNCSFCYSKNIKNSGKELTTEDWKSFINSFGKKKKLFYITGGEPFLRKDIFKIIAAIKKQGSYCGIVTNGTLLPEKDLEKIIDLRVDNVVFSLHGLAETHNRILKIDNAFEKATKAISELNKLRKRSRRKTPYIMVNHVINASTKNEANELIKLCMKLGADEIRFAHPSFLYHGELKKHSVISRERCDLEIKSSQHSKKINDIIFMNDVLKRKLKIRVSTYPNLSDGEIKEWYSKSFKTKRKCLYIYTSCFISETGDVYPCHFYSFSMGNIKKEKFDAIWNNKRSVEFRKIIRKSLLPGCSRCCKLF